MSQYIAPIRDMQFVLKELAGLEQVLAAAGMRGSDPDLVDAVLEEAAKFAEGVLAAERSGRPGRRPLARQAGHDAEGLQGGLPAVRGERLVGAPANRNWWPGSAEGRERLRHRDVEIRQPCLLAVPAADPRAPSRRWCWLARTS